MFYFISSTNANTIIFDKIPKTLSVSSFSLVTKVTAIFNFPFKEIISINIFKTLIIIEVFEEEYLLKVLEEFPGIEDVSWWKYDNVFEKKLAYNNFFNFGENTSKLFDELNSRKFVKSIDKQRDKVGRETLKFVDLLRKKGLTDAADDLLDSYKNNVIKFGLEVKKIMRKII